MARSSTKQKQLNLSKKYLKIANCDEWITDLEIIEGNYFFAKNSLLKELKNVFNYHGNYDLPLIKSKLKDSFMKDKL